LISRALRLKGAAIAACALAGAVPAAAAAAGKHALPGSKPSWARSSNHVGSVSGSETKTFWVYLGLRNGAALDRQVKAVSDPGSAEYGSYLTASQFNARYAPTSADVDAVRSWLQGAGFDVAAAAPAGNRWVEASGSVARIESAFGVQELTYRHAGRTLDAPDAAPSVPGSLASAVAGVAGLDDSDTLVQPQSTRAASHDLPSADPKANPSPAFVNAPPCSSYYGEKTASTLPDAYDGQKAPYATCGYTPSQLQGAYGLTAADASSASNGSGQTVGIVDAFASPTIQQDANTYASRHGQGPVAITQYNTHNLEHVSEHEKSGCDPQGWYGEETLDVEAVHAMAPGAKEAFAGALDCNDENLIDAVNRLLQNSQAQVISNSYGGVGESEPASLLAAWEATFKQAAVQGVGIYFSSGDDGDEVANAGTRTVDYPASDPFVTAVGGTSLGVGRANDYQFETGWSTGVSSLAGSAWAPPYPGDYLYGGGGGTSVAFDQPSYQAGVVPADIADHRGATTSTTPGRAVPDVSAVGDPNTGMLVGQTQTFPTGPNNRRYGEYRIGGTSLSSPLFAGMMALADQAAGHRHGFANPLFYGQAGSTTFRDVKPDGVKRGVVRNDYVNGVDGSDGISTTLRSLDFKTSIFTRPGYDDVTGVGSPNGAAFLAGLR
jgi:subtilase family serine protease